MLAKRMMPVAAAAVSRRTSERRPARPGTKVWWSSSKVAKKVARPRLTTKLKAEVNLPRVRK